MHMHAHIQGCSVRVAGYFISLPCDGDNSYGNYFIKHSPW